MIMYNQINNNIANLLRKTIRIPYFPAARFCRQRSDQRQNRVAGGCITTHHPKCTRTVFERPYRRPSSA